ncbi:MAG: STAS domain-containing protein [Planctomycetota bacterium]
MPGSGPETIGARLRKWSDDVLLLEFNGEIEMDTANVFREHLEVATKRKPKGIAVDLSQIDYMDSSGVAVLIEVLRWCRRDGIRFLLVNPSQAVQRAKHVVHLSDAFETAADRDAAWRVFVDSDLLPTPDVPDGTDAPAPEAAADLMTAGD